MLIHRAISVHNQLVQATSAHFCKEVRVLNVPELAGVKSVSRGDAVARLAGWRLVYSPPEGPEFCKLAKIPQIGSYDCYSRAACAHRNQGVVIQSPLS